MRILTGCWIIFLGSIANAALAADDGYIKADGNRWTLGTAAVERVVALEDGKLLLKSFKNKVTGRELIADGCARPTSSSSGLDDAKQPLTGSTGPWKLIGDKQTKLKQGELQLELTLQRDSLVVTKTYVVYPGSSIIRQWVTFTNAGNRPLKIVEPGFLSETVRPGDADATDFHWMTGGENVARLLDAEDREAEPRRSRARSIPTSRFRPPPSFRATASRRRFSLNGKQVWPANGWQHVGQCHGHGAGRFQRGRGGRRQAGVRRQHERQYRLRHDRVRPDDHVRRRRNAHGLEGVQRQAGRQRLAIPVHRGRQVRRSGLLSRAEAVAQAEGQRRRARRLSGPATSIPTPIRMPFAFGPRRRRDACA